VPATALEPAAAGERAAGRRPLLGYALVLAAVALWSVHGTVAKVVMESGGLSSLRLAEVRASGAGFVLLAAVALLRPRSLRLSAREGAYLVVFGVAGLAFVHFFYFAAIARLDIGVALVIQYLAPVLVAVWARFFVHEPMRRRIWLALATSFTGLCLVVEIWSGLALDTIGVAASLACAVSYALYLVMADHSLRGGRDVYSLLAWGFVFATLFWTVIQPWWRFPGDLIVAEASLLGRLAEVRAPVWLLLAYVVVLGTVVPFILMVSALRHITPTRAAIVAMTEPVLGSLVAFAWLGEELGAAQVVGGFLVLGAVGLAQTARPPGA
jgi:drug/metabolite transporter (DMT)-like permease